MHHSFETQDTLRFLNPKVFYVGATFDDNECQLARFIEKGIWENGYFKSPHVSAKTEKYKEYTSDMAKGDVMLVKRLDGMAQPTMRLLAAGIVLGRNTDKTVRVAWVRPQLDVHVPLHTVGTISPGYRLADLSEPARKEADKARSRFLRHNLAIEDRWY